MALTKPTLNEVVKPHLKDEYIKTIKGQCKDDSTPSLEYPLRLCFLKHALLDKREPGAFKKQDLFHGKKRTVDFKIKLQKS